MAELKSPPIMSIEHRILKGTITAIDASWDCADVELADGEIWQDVPIFYHCHPGAEKRENGALTGASAAFEPGDEVWVRFEPNQWMEETPVIFGRVDGLKICRLQGFFFKMAGAGGYVFKPPDKLIGHGTGGKNPFTFYKAIASCPDGDDPDNYIWVASCRFPPRHYREHPELCEELPQSNEFTGSDPDQRIKVPCLLEKDTEDAYKFKRDNENEIVEQFTPSPNQYLNLLNFQWETAELTDNLNPCNCYYPHNNRCGQLIGGGSDCCENDFDPPLNPTYCNTGSGSYVQTLGGLENKSAPLQFKDCAEAHGGGYRTREEATLNGEIIDPTKDRFTCAGDAGIVPDWFYEPGLTECAMDTRDYMWSTPAFFYPIPVILFPVPIWSVRNVYYYYDWWTDAQRRTAHTQEEVFLKSLAGFFPELSLGNFNYYLHRWTETSIQQSYYWTRLKRGQALAIASNLIGDTLWKMAVIPFKDDGMKIYLNGNDITDDFLNLWEESTPYDRQYFLDNYIEMYAY